MQGRKRELSEFPFLFYTEYEIAEKGLSTILTITLAASVTD